MKISLKLPLLGLCAVAVAMVGCCTFSQKPALKFVTMPETYAQGTLGGEVTFATLACVSGAAKPTITYQWQREGADMPGETNRVLTLKNLTLTSPASFVVVVRAEGFGALISEPAVLSVGGLLLNTLPSSDVHTKAVSGGFLSVPVSATTISSGTSNECVLLGSGANQYDRVFKLNTTGIPSAATFAGRNATALPVSGGPPNPKPNPNLYTHLTVDTEGFATDAANSKNPDRLKTALVLKANLFNFPKIACSTTNIAGTINQARSGLSGFTNAPLSLDTMQKGWAHLQLHYDSKTLPTGTNTILFFYTYWKQ